MPGAGVDGVRVSHLSRRELVCLGHEKLLEPEEREGLSWESVTGAQGRTGHIPETHKGPHHPRGFPVVPTVGMKGPHLLLLVHNSLAARVKHSESTQDGLLRVGPCGKWGGERRKG